MSSLRLLLATEHFVHVDRDDRLRASLVSALGERDRRAAPLPCCPPPCCFRSWEAL